MDLCTFDLIFQILSQTAYLICCMCQVSSVSRAFLTIGLLQAALQALADRKHMLQSITQRHKDVCSCASDLRVSWESSDWDARASVMTQAGQIMAGVQDWSLSNLASFSLSN